MAPDDPVRSCAAYSKFLQSYILPEHWNNMWAFAYRVWNATPGTEVENPQGVSVNHCNDAVSILLQYKEQCNQKNLLVEELKATEIRKVAEIRGSRFNTGKLRMDLIDPLAMEGLASVLTKGAVKYNAHNWRQGLPYMEIIASLLRHTMAVARGEDIDPETGEYHADHMQCNTMFLSNMMKTRPDMDDRWKPPSTGRKSETPEEFANRATKETQQWLDSQAVKKNSTNLGSS